MVCVWATLLLLLLVGAFGGGWDLKGHTALITGGTKGIGRSIVEDFLALGCGKIVTCSRSASDLEELRAALGDGAARVKTVVADVSTEEGRATLVDFCKQELEGSLTILVNNVGSNIRKPAIEYSSAEYQMIMQTNLESCFFLTQSLHPLLLQAASTRGGASVVNIGSVAGGCGSSIKSGAVYAATKAAMLQFTQSLACEWGPSKIRVNCVSPWYISTPLAEQVLKNPDYAAAVMARTPMKRVGRVEEVAAAVSFLAMDRASYITGTNLPVDGGFLRCGFY